MQAKEEDEDFIRFALGRNLWKTVGLKHVEAVDETKLRPIVKEAMQETLSEFKRFEDWGAMHVQIIQHPLAFMPVVGRRYRFMEYGAAGGPDTLFKGTGSKKSGKIQVTFGANSRHLSDLSDVNENYFVLLGGQDGWLTNENLFDQAELWREGRYMKVPLTPEAFKDTAEYRMVLSIGQ
jgi:penicillin amidase